MMLPDATLALTAALAILQLAHMELWDVHFLFAYLRNLNHAQTAVFSPILANFLNAVQTQIVLNPAQTAVLDALSHAIDLNAL